MSSKYFGTTITEKFLPHHMQVYICLIFFILKGKVGKFRIGDFHNSYHAVVLQKLKGFVKEFYANINSL